MDESKYDPDFEYDEYDDYPDSGGVTNVGLPASQLALIIGVNAVVSLVIAISVVLIAGRQVPAGNVDALVTETDVAVADAGQSEDALSSEAEEGQGDAAAQSTPIQSVVYAVEAGDTLTVIAKKFAIPISDIMQANGLTNQDFIQVGQELIIPVGGLSTATPTFTPQPLPTDTPLPFDPPTPLPEDAQVPQEPAATVGPSPTPTDTPPPTATPIAIPTSTPAPFGELNVVVSEVSAPGDLMGETLVILNKGAGTSLADWKLEGSSLGIFVFPDIFLFSGGSIRIHTSAGENTASDLYLNQGEAAWTAGNSIILSDNKGVEISRLTVASDETSTEELSSPTATP